MIWCFGVESGLVTADTLTMNHRPCLFFAWCVLFATGCSGPGSAHQSGRRPPDFVVGVTLLNTESDPSEALRPAWYLVEADSQLRAAAGTRRADSPLPGIVRQLSPKEVDDLWRIVDGAQFSRIGREGSTPGELESPGGAEAGPTALVYIASHGRRRSFRVLLGAEDPRERGARELAARLEALALGLR